MTGTRQVSAERAARAVVVAEEKLIAAHAENLKATNAGAAEEVRRRGIELASDVARTAHRRNEQDVPAPKPSLTLAAEASDAPPPRPMTWQ